jgi:hypothetical protein
MAFGALRGTLTGNNTSPTTGISATGSVSVTAGDLVVVSYALRVTGNTVTVQDNLGNHYTQLPSIDTVGNSPSRPFYCIVKANGTLTTVTGSHTTTTGDAAVAVSVFEGVFDGWAVDKFTTQSADSTSPYTCANSGTLNQADEVIVGIQSQGNGGAAASYAATSPYTIGGTASSGTGANTTSTALNHHLVSSTTGEAPEITSSASTSGGTQTASFRKLRTSPAIGDCIGLFGDGFRAVSGNGSLTGFCTVAVGDVVVVVWGGLISTPTNFSAASDNLGNSYTMVTGDTDAGGNGVRAAYSIVTVAGNLTTITATRAGTEASCFQAAVFKGPATALDVTVAAADIASATPISWGATGTLAQADELIIAYSGDHAARLYTPVSPSVLAGQAFSGNAPGGGNSANIFSRLVSSTSSVTMQTNQDTAAATVGGVLTFKVTVPVAVIPDGKQELDLPPPPYPPPGQTWLWQYNKNLIAQDAMVTGEQFTDRPRGQPDYHVQLRTWIGPLPLAAPEQVPFNQEYWPLTPAPTPLPQDIDLQNLLLTTLAAPPEPPAVEYVFRGPLYINPRGHPYPPDLRSWIGPKTQPLIEYVFNGPLYTNPRGHPYSVDLRSWFGKFPPTPLPFKALEWTVPRAHDYHINLRSWAGMKVPSPALFTKPFNQQDWPVPVGYEYHISLRSWAGIKTSSAALAAVLPIGQIITALPPQPEYPLGLRFWFASPKPVTPPVIEYVFGAPLYTNPRGYEYPVQLRQLFGAIPPTPPVAVQYVFRGPLYVNPRTPEYHVQLRSFFGRIPPPAVVVAVPFSEYDWPNPKGPVYPVDLATITKAFNLNLIGQDKLPTGEIVTERPVLATPAAKTFTASYNLNLIGKDQLPVGKDAYDLPPQPPLSAVQLRTWIHNAALALITTPPVKPFAQYDWPLNTGPKQPTQIFVASYNKNLIGQDRLPVGAITTGLPAQQRLAAQTWINAVNLALTSVQVLPFNQNNWPLNLGPRQVDRSYGYVFPKTLVGQDRLPFRQMDWPLYRPFLQPAFGFTASYNRNLIGKDRLPFRQQHWPLTPDHRRLSDWILETDPNLYIPPPPPPGPRDPTHARTRGGFELDARGASLDHRGASIDQRGTSPDRRGGGRSSRGRNES